MEYISALELKGKLDQGESITVIDIREAYELDICKVDTFKHIPMAEVEARIDEFLGGDHIVICCKSGNRARPVTNLLMQDHGLQNVSILEGGILAWIEKIDNSLEAY